MLHNICISAMAIHSDEQAVAHGLLVFDMKNVGAGKLGVFSNERKYYLYYIPVFCLTLSCWVKIPDVFSYFS